MIRHRTWLRRGLLALILLNCSLLWAHESMPASLMVRERAEHQFDVTWRLPQTQGPAPAIAPRFPTDCQNLTPPQEHIETGAKLQRWRIDCTQGLRHNATLGFDGLSVTLLDVLVRVTYLDGHTETQVARARTPIVTLDTPAAQTPALEVPAYFSLGVEHILSGIDHLLFVFCLILLVPSVKDLVKTITAFTVAHSLTLALSALNLVRVAQAPVEATIALSILFLARELARREADPTTRLDKPWAVAFVFGLLHGFGFAGALAEVGLPQGAIPQALFLFNVGVEAGQLAFVALVYPLVLWVRSRPQHWPNWVTPVPVYAVGSVAAFWWLQRMVMVLVGQPV